MRIGDDSDVDDGERDVTHIGTFEDVSAELEAERVLNVVLQRDAERRAANRRLREVQARGTVQLAVSPPMPLPVITVPPVRSFPLLPATFAIMVGFLVGVLILASTGRGIVSMGW